MAYKLKISEETDPIRIEKRRKANRIKQMNWAHKNPERYNLRKKLYKKSRILPIKTFINTFKKECLHCGFNKNPIALDFHHLDKKTKFFRISQTSVKIDEKTLVEEMAKCIVLCANCHRIEEERLRMC